MTFTFLIFVIKYYLPYFIYKKYLIFIFKNFSFFFNFHNFYLGFKINEKNSHDIGREKIANMFVVFYFYIVFEFRTYYILQDITFTFSIYKILPSHFL